MNRMLPVAALLASSLALPATAQTQERTTGAKPQVKRIADKPARRAAPAPAPVELDLPAAAGEQTAAASMTHFGEYQCEFNQKLVVGMNKKHDAYLDVTFGNRIYTMRPVLSHTGAIRLEDVRGQMLIVQIATKSMMMDTQAGRRVVDDCKHENQVAAAATLRAEQGIGISSDVPASPPAAAAPATVPTVASTDTPPPVAR
jgi:hypothetical protein